MISCTVEEDRFIVFYRDGVEFYDIDMEHVKGEAGISRQVNDMSMKNWVAPSMLDHIEKTMRRHLRNEWAGESVTLCHRLERETWEGE